MCTYEIGVQKERKVSSILCSMSSPELCVQVIFKSAVDRMLEVLQGAGSVSLSLFVPTRIINLPAVLYINYSECNPT